MFKINATLTNCEFKLDKNKTQMKNNFFTTEYTKHTEGKSQKIAEKQKKIPLLKGSKTVSVLICVKQKEVINKKD